MRLVNRYFDAVADATVLPPAERAAVLEAMEAKFQFDPNIRPRDFLNAEVLTRALIGKSMPSAQLAVRAEVRMRTKRSLLRVLCAARLFELDRGRPAGSKDDLVPAYLPEWPADESDGRPLRTLTRPDGRWTVYGLDTGDRDPGEDPAPKYLRVELGGPVEATRPPAP